MFSDFKLAYFYNTQSYQIAKLMKTQSALKINNNE
jgi:hypothetical protein